MENSTEKEKTVFDRVKNLKGDGAYSHSTSEGRKNHNGMLKRKLTTLEDITETLWKRCGIPSVFMYYSELHGFKTVVGPSGAEHRPSITIEQRQSIMESLKRSLRFHPENLEYQENDALTIIPRASVINILKDPEQTEFTHIQTLSAALQNTLSKRKLYCCANILSAQKVSVSLAPPITSYPRSVVASYCVLMMTLVNVDNLTFNPDIEQHEHIIGKLKPIQRMGCSLYRLENPQGCQVINLLDLDLITVEILEAEETGRTEEEETQGAKEPVKETQDEKTKEAETEEEIQQETQGYVYEFLDESGVLQRIQLVPNTGEIVEEIVDSTYEPEIQQSADGISSEKQVTESSDTPLRRSSRLNKPKNLLIP